MSFDKSNFANGGNAANAPAIHTYKTVDAQADINSANYFNDLVDEVRVGDAIYAFTDTDGTPAAFIFAVNANDGTNVDVTDGLAIGTTDSD